MMFSIINPIDSLLTSEYETVYPVHSKTMDEMGGRGGLYDGVAGTLENPDHEQYANIDGEAETNYAGSKMQFASSSGRLVCHDVAEASSHKELQLSESNYIPPVKEVWLAQNGGGNGETGRRAASRDRFPRCFAFPLTLDLPACLQSGINHTSTYWERLSSFSLWLYLISSSEYYQGIGLAKVAPQRSGHSRSTGLSVGNCKDMRLAILRQ